LETELFSFVAFRLKQLEVHYSVDINGGKVEPPLAYYS